MMKSWPKLLTSVSNRQVKRGHSCHFNIGLSLLLWVQSQYYQKERKERTNKCKGNSGPRVKLNWHTATLIHVQAKAVSGPARCQLQSRLPVSPGSTLLPITNCRDAAVAAHHPANRVQLSLYLTCDTYVSNRKRGRRGV